MIDTYLTLEDKRLLLGIREILGTIACGCLHQEGPYYFNPFSVGVTLSVVLDSLSTFIGLDLGADESNESEEIGAE